MSTTLRPRAMWCIGIPASDVACISGCVGKECRVSTHDRHVFDDESHVFDDESFELADEPSLIWIDASLWDSVAARAAAKLPSVPRVLVCPAEAQADPSHSTPANELDAFIAADAEYAARAPLSEDGVFRILRRSLEQHNIYHDMCRMTREIFLCRELLTRKSDVLALLLEADCRLRSAETERDILMGVRTVVGDMFEVQALHAVLWDFEIAEDGLDLYFDGVDPNSERGRVWEMFLLDAASRLLPYVPPVRRTATLDGKSSLLPDEGYPLVLPLSVRDAAAGAVVLLLPCEPGLSRDQSLALRMIMACAASLLRLSAQEAANSTQSAPATRLSYDDALSRMRLAQ